MLLVKDLVSFVREEAQQPATGGLLTDNEIARYLSEAQESIYTDIRLIDETYFEDRIDITFSSTGETTLPAALRRRAIQDVRILRADTNTQIPLRYLYHKEIPMGEGNVQSSRDAEYWYLLGETLGIWPRPTSETVRVVIVRRPTPMIYARVSGAPAIGATTFSIKALDSAGGDVGQIVNDRSDFVGELLRFDSGAEQANEYRVTAWNPVTRTFTISPALASGAADGNLVGTLSIISREFQGFLVAYAVYRCLEKFREGPEVERAMQRAEMWRRKSIVGAHRHVNETHPMVPDGDMGIFRHPQSLG